MKGKKNSVYLETFGCQMNVSDSERVVTLLEKKGFDIIKNEENADIVLLNTCSVREKAENKLYTRIGQIRKTPEGKNKVVGVLGCVAQLEGETLFENREIDFVLGTKAVGRIDESIKRVFAGSKKVVDLTEREIDYDWDITVKNSNSPYISFVPIIEGCNKFCTYCIVPFSRGREKSRLANEIINSVEKLRNEGIKEIHLIGQNVNSYRPLSQAGLEHISGATAFSKLLRAVAQTGIERIKFTTSFPRDFHPDIVNAINEYENLCNWVHLPVQSGSNQILRKMRRGHTIEDYKKRIDVIKNSPQDISITTDIIVGFPGETREDFEETKKLFEYCNFDSAYIFKYSVRKGTPAAFLDQNISENVITDRFLELEALQKSIQKSNLSRYLGRVVKVLVEGHSVKSNSEYTGHSTCQKVVNFEADESLLGKVVDVVITDCKNNSLFGKLV